MGFIEAVLFVGVIFAALLSIIAMSRTADIHKLVGNHADALYNSVDAIDTARKKEDASIRTELNRLGLDVRLMKNDVTVLSNSDERSEVVMNTIQRTTILHVQAMAKAMTMVLKDMGYTVVETVPGMESPASVKKSKFKSKKS